MQISIEKFHYSIYRIQLACAGAKLLIPLRTSYNRLFGKMFMCGGVANGQRVLFILLNPSLMIMREMRSHPTTYVSCLLQQVQARVPVCQTSCQIRCWNLPPQGWQCQLQHHYQTHLCQYAADLVSVVCVDHSACFSNHCYHMLL